MEEYQGSIDILLFAEDPGGANYLAPFVSQFKEKNWSWRVLANGFARNTFDQHKLKYDDCSLINKNADQWIESLNPKLVLVGTAENPQTMGLFLIKSARSKCIPSVGVIDAYMNARHRFSARTSDPKAFAPDYVFVADVPTQEAFLEIGYTKESLIVCGNPLYDYVLNLRRQLEKVPRSQWRGKYFPKVSKDENVVAFLSEGYAEGRTEPVLQEFIRAMQKINPKPYLVFRLHPKDTLENFNKYLKEFNFISQGGSAHEMVYASDLVVSLTSMLLTEAALLGRKTISIVQNTDEGRWLPSVRAGITPCIDMNSDLKGTLLGLLKERETVNEREAPFVLEGAAKNGTQFLQGLLEKRV